MKTEEEFKDAFIQMLKEKGYPESAIKTEYQYDEYPLSRKLRGDIVILRGKVVVQAFELKTRNDKHTIMNGLHQVEVIRQSIGSEDYKVPTYLVSVDENNEIVFYDNEHMLTPIRNIDKLLDYNKAVQSYTNRARQWLQDTFEFNKVKWTCWTLSIIILIFVIAALIMSQKNEVSFENWLNINSFMFIALSAIIALLPILLYMPTNVKKIKINLLALEMALEY